MTMFPSRVDVVIIGAGPAGLAASIVCSKAGLRTVVVERNAEPLIVPAESLHPGCESLLDKLGVGQAFRRENFPRFMGIRSFGTLHPFGKDEQGPWLGFHIQRDRFERLLEAHALSLGVEVFRGMAVTGLVPDHGRIAGIRRGERILRAAWVIDAGGRRHAVAQWLKLEKEVQSSPVIAFRGEVAGSFICEKDVAQFERHERGWLWTAQTSPNRCTWTLLAPRKTEPSLPDKLAACSPTLPQRGLDVTWRAIRPLVKPGCVLAGDAAALLDPAAGQGVLFALHSGFMAATTILKCFFEPHLEPVHLTLYDDWAMQQFGYKVRGLREIYASLDISIAAQTNAAKEEHKIARKQKKRV